MALLQTQESSREPPGLDMEHLTSLNDRFDMLEKVFVLTDWEQIESTTKSILLGAPICEPDKGEPQPDPEVSPTKLPCGGTFCTPSPDGQVSGRCLHFEIFSDDGEAKRQIVQGRLGDHYN